VAALLGSWRRYSRPNRPPTWNPTSRNAGFVETIWAPIHDLLKRLGPMAVAIPLLVAGFRMPGYVPLFKHQGLTNTDIATVTKVFGFWIALGGTFMAGWLIPRIGMMSSLLMSTVAGSASAQGPPKAACARRRGCRLRVDGVSDFNALHARKHDNEVQFCAFDLVVEDGDDLRGLPVDAQDTLRGSWRGGRMASSWRRSRRSRSLAGRVGCRPVRCAASQFRPASPALIQRIKGLPSFWKAVMAIWENCSAWPRFSTPSACLDCGWWRDVSGIRRGMYRCSANCLLGFTLDEWRDLNFIRRAIYQWLDSCRIIISSSQ
jgi:hypothetical protein